MLITASEVVRYSPLSKTFPVDSICLLIDTHERMLVDCFGQSFFDYLICNLTTLPQEDWKDWVEKTWPSNSAVLFNGRHYVSFTDTKGIPGVSSDWQSFTRFKNNKYLNDLWEKYLREYLAFDIASSAITYATYTANAHGVMVHQDHNTNMFTANQTQITVLKNEYIIHRDRIKKQMIDWIITTHNKLVDDNNCKSPFETISFLSKSNCSLNNNNKCNSNHGRRFSFRY